VNYVVGLVKIIFYPQGLFYICAGQSLKSRKNIYILPTFSTGKWKLAHTKNHFSPSFPQAHPQGFLCPECLLT